MDSLSQVPHIFLDPGFDLKNPDTFAKIFPFLLNSKEKLSSQIETHGKVTQEKFAHYLDSVEVNIADQVAQKSHHFFQVCQIKLFLYSSYKIDFLGEFEHQSGAPNSRGKLPHGSKGFRFRYVQRQCEKERCFQCNFLKNGVHEAKSCPGPHFHKVISNFNCFFYKPG